jgi:hypothetical protein
MKNSRSVLTIKSRLSVWGGKNGSPTKLGLCVRDRSNSRKRGIRPHGCDRAKAGAVRGVLATPARAPLFSLLIQSARISGHPQFYGYRSFGEPAQEGCAKPIIPIAESARRRIPPVSGGSSKEGAAGVFLFASNRREAVAREHLIV